MSFAGGKKHILLVALTGYGADEDRRRALSVGFDYHLVKPVNVEALEGLVTRFGKSDGAAGKPPAVH